MDDKDSSRPASTDEDKLRRFSERNEQAVDESKQGLSRPLDDEQMLARLRRRLAAKGIVD
jgi:hypothetical protein